MLAQIANGQVEMFADQVIENIRPDLERAADEMQRCWSGDVGFRGCRGGNHHLLHIVFKRAVQKLKAEGIDARFDPSQMRMVCYW
jgi:hypothetical protein